jgi:hypothetical protein
MGERGLVRSWCGFRGVGCVLGFLPNPVMYLAGELRRVTAVKRQTSEERKGAVVSEGDRENKAPLGADAPMAIPHTPGWPLR